MLIDIKNRQGLIKVSIPIQNEAKGVFSLMTSDYILLPFSTEEVIPFSMGDYADLTEIMDDALGGKVAKIYEVVDLPTPAYNETTGAYDYQLRLDAYYWKWKHKIFKYTPEDGGQEASWSLTAALDVHLGIVLRNLKALGYTYKGTEFTFNIDATVENKAVSVTYDNINILDALFTLASENYYNCDCWITDNVIHFGRNEFGDAVKIERGVEAAKIEKAQSKGTYATRVYAFGSTRNIPVNYRPTEEQTVVNGVVQKRLMLPKGTPYVDAYENMTTEEAIEDVVVFEDIYPRMIGTLSDIATVDRDIITDGEVTGTYKAYQYKDTELIFDEKYIIEGQDLAITFQSGKLNGMTFGVQFNPNNESPAEQLWEIVANEDYGRLLPDDIIRPENGDKYILSGFNIQLISDAYIPAAEQELKERAQKYVEITKKDDGTYPVTLFSDFVFDDPIRHNYQFGQRINLVDLAYFPNGRESRVLGWEINLDIPWDSPKYTIGESMPYSRIQEIEEKVEALTYKGQTYTGGGGGIGVYIIRTNDSTAPSDANVFSALRSLATLHRKDKTDVNQFLQKFLGGLMSDNIESQDFASGAFGTGFVIKRDPKTGKSYIEADELYIRLKAYFDTLEIKHLSHVGGRVVLSPASMECNRVEILSGESESLFDSAGSQLIDKLEDPINAILEGGEKVYRCYFNNSDGEREIVNEFAIDDLAQCREFNVKTNISHNVSNQYYWRRVVGLGSNYIDLSIDDCDAGSMIPKAGDTIVAIGNKTDPNRQHVVFLSSYDDDAPCLKLYSGINTYSMLNKEKTVISPNADKNVFTGKVVIKPGSVGFGNLTDAPDMSLIESEIQDAKDDAQAAKDAVTKALGDVNDLKDYVDGAFSDGIISEAEAKAIEKYINIVNSTSQSAEKAYNELYNNSYLEGSAKVSLSNSYYLLKSTITTLINAIETAIADGRTTQGEKQAVDTAYENFNQAYSNFIRATEAANKSIQDKLKGYSDNAQMAADEANNNASQAMEDALDAKEAVENLNDYVDGAFSDGIISETEAKAIEKYINIVTQTKKECDATYEKLYSNAYLSGTAKSNLYSKKNAFNTATSNLITAIQSAIADGKTTTSEKNNVDSKYTAFNTAYANLATAIEDANKAIQDKIKQEAVNDATDNAISEIGKVSEQDKNTIAQKLGYSNYKALEDSAKRGETIIQGGMLNTKLINAELIITSALIAQAIMTNSLNVNNTLYLNSDGSIKSKSGYSALEIAKSYLRIFLNTNFAEQIRLAVDEITGRPELAFGSYTGGSAGIYRGDSFALGTKSGRELVFDANKIGAGTIYVKEDGTLALLSDGYTDMVNITISASPSNGGTTSPSGTLQLPQGSLYNVNATPNSGYEFDRWSDGGSQSHTISVSKDLKLTAYFTKIVAQQITVTLKASPSNGGAVSGGGTFDKGTKRTITATPNSGYRFVRWSDGGAQSHSVTWDSNKTITAYFEAYSVTGDEIFKGADLKDDTYWSVYGGAKLLVLGTVVFLTYTGDTSGNQYIAFNKGYLGSKLEQGHRYRLLMTIKSNKTEEIPIIALFGTELDITSSVSEEGIIYGEYNGGVVTNVQKNISFEFTADRDSTTNDAFIITTAYACTLYITEISLKEV